MDKQLNLAYVTPYFHPLKGGVENYCLQLALRAARDGHKVTVYTSDRRFGRISGRREEDYQGIKIVRLRRYFFNQYYLSFLPGLLPALFKANHDVIHSHVPGVFWQDTVLTLTKLFKRQKPILINTPHDPFMSRGGYSMPERVLRWAYNAWLKIYYSKIYNYVIAVNPAQLGWITGNYLVPAEHVITVLNGLDDEAFKTIHVDNDIINNYQLAGKVVITNIARYHQYKGHQQVLQALAELKNKKQLNLKYIAIGVDSGMLKRLQNYVADNQLEEFVELLENPNDTVRDQILELAEIYINSSRSEAFGIGTLEAMAKGAAIIATTTEGSKYLVTSKNGLLYDFGNIEKLKEHIVNLVQNTELRKQFQEYNIKYAQQFNWDKTYLSYRELLSKIINKLGSK